MRTTARRVLLWQMIGCFEGHNEACTACYWQALCFESRSFPCKHVCVRSQEVSSSASLHLRPWPTPSFS